MYIFCMYRLYCVNVVGGVKVFVGGRILFLYIYFIVNFYDFLFLDYWIEFYFFVVFRSKFRSIVGVNCYV